MQLGDFPPAPFPSGPGFDRELAQRTLVSELRTCISTSTPHPVWVRAGFRPTGCLASFELEPPHVESALERCLTKASFGVRIPAFVPAIPITNLRDVETAVVPFPVMSNER
jgi:hypothetical protein